MKTNFISNLCVFQYPTVYQFQIGEIKIQF